MKRKLLLICCLLMTFVLAGHAIKITCYVAQGANGDDSPMRTLRATS